MVLTECGRAYEQVSKHPIVSSHLLGVVSLIIELYKGRVLFSKIINIIAMLLLKQLETMPSDAEVQNKREEEEEERKKR